MIRLNSPEKGDGVGVKMHVRVAVAVFVPLTVDVPDLVAECVVDPLRVGVRVLVADEVNVAVRVGVPDRVNVAVDVHNTCGQSSPRNLNQQQLL